MSDTIAAISTPQNTGGIGIIRVSGDKAIEICDKIFFSKSGKSLKEKGGYTASFGDIKEKDEKIDEGVALIFRAPKSYTGENVVELSCHGGLFVLKRVLRAVICAGARPAEAGEFTKRAFLNGKMDLTEAEAVMSIIGAQGEQGAKAALTALDGALSRKLSGICHSLVSVCAAMSAWVDYPDEDIEELSYSSLEQTLENAKTQLEKLLRSFDAGSAVTRGVDTAIVGRPNVGKSSLMNLLSGFKRSIVTDIAGTTRDVVEQTVNLGSVLLHLADTAGIRDTDDKVESIGVDMAKDRTQRATLVLAVFDMSQPLETADEEILALCKGKRAIAVLNKSDLVQRADEEKIKSFIPCAVKMCAADGSGIEQLEKAAEELLCVSELDTSQAMLMNERQRNNTQLALDEVEQALEALCGGITLDAVNVCIDCAVNRLLEITGEKATDAVVDEIFAQFCVGK